jgi:hypothetical protein
VSASALSMGVRPAPIGSSRDHPRRNERACPPSVLPKIAGLTSDWKARSSLSAIRSDRSTGVTRRDHPCSSPTYPRMNRLLRQSPQRIATIHLLRGSARGGPPTETPRKLPRRETASGRSPRRVWNSILRSCGQRFCPGEQWIESWHSRNSACSAGSAGLKLCMRSFYGRWENMSLTNRTRRRIGIAVAAAAKMAAMRWNGTGLNGTIQRREASVIQHW